MSGVLPYGGWSIQLTPVPIKLYKDFFSFLIFICVFFYCLKYSELRQRMLSIRVASIYGLLLSVFIAFFISLTEGDFVSSLVGIRSFFCISFFFLGFLLSTVMDEKKLSNAMFIMLLISFMLQVYQRYYQLGVPVFGEIRSPGIFIVPATAGLFSLVCMHSFFKIKSSFIYKVIAIVSLVLSTSTIGIVSMLFTIQYFISRFLFKKNLVARFLFLLLLAIFGFSIFITYAGILSGRGEAVFQTATSRINILNAYFENITLQNILFGGKFGLVTAKAVITADSSAFVADNTFLALFASLGFFGCLFFIIFIIYFYFLDKNKLLSVAMILYAMTANVFELSPVSQLLFLFTGLTFGEFKKQDKSPN